MLLRLATPTGPSGSESNSDSVASTARSVVSDALGTMSASDFVDGTLVVLQSDEVTVQTGALNLLGEQLPNIKEDVRAKSKKSVVQIIDIIRKLLLSKNGQEQLDASLYALNTIASTMASGEESALATTVTIVVAFVQEQQSAASAAKTLLSLTTNLGPRVIPYFKDIVNACLSVGRQFDSEENTDKSALSASLHVLQSLLNSIPKFWSSVELTQVIKTFIESKPETRARMTSFTKVLTRKAPSKALLSVLCNMWTSLPRHDQNALSGFFTILKKAIKPADRPTILEHIRLLFKSLLDAFELCASTAEFMDSIEPFVISTFIELVVKLNEAAFKPLFRKLFDWAFASDDNNSASRKLVFCHVYGALLEYFKGLMTPYMSFLFQPFIEILDGYRQSTAEPALWLAIIQTLTRTFIHDDGAFWRDDKLRQLSSSLIEQVPVCVTLNSVLLQDSSKPALTECLLAMTDNIHDDSVLKSLNINLLMHTRSEDPKLRLFALTCAEALWRAHGGKLLGFVSETATFIAESAEDENDTIVREARKLKEAVESVAGKLDL